MIERKEPLIWLKDRNILMNKEARDLPWTWGIQSPGGLRWVGGRGKLVDFLIDTGGTHSVVNTKVAQKTSQSILVMGTKLFFWQPLECQLGDLTLKHSILYMPVCPVSLLGQDLLCNFNAQVTVLLEELDIRVPPEHAVRLHGTHGHLRKGQNSHLPAPLLPGLQKGKAGSVGWWHPRIGQKHKANTNPIKKGCWDTWYPLKQETHKGIHPVLKRFLKIGLITLCLSLYNTRIFPVKKWNPVEYCFV